MTTDNEPVNYFWMWLTIVAWIISMIAFVLTDGQVLRNIVLICVLIGFIGIGMHFVRNFDLITRNKSE